MRVVQVRRHEKLEILTEGDFLVPQFQEILAAFFYDIFQQNWFYERIQFLPHILT